MLSINGKKFMNISEAVQWLLDNNALPFQSTANYVADTVIAKTTIVNPSPAEIKIGSLVLFADSKVGTVSGITDTGFMVGQDYTDIGSRLNQITGIDIDASRHLVFTLSNGDTIDAGLVKEVSSFSIDASQHLIATYTDGSTQDIGSILQGNVNISGTLTATHAKIFEQIEDANDNNRFVEGDITIGTFTGVTQTYGKWSLCGTHLLIVVGLSLETGSNITDGDLCYVTIPSWIGAKIYPLFAGTVVTRAIAKMWADDYTTQDLTTQLIKVTNATFKIQTSTTTADKDRFVRVSFDLLIDNN